MRPHGASRFITLLLVIGLFPSIESQAQEKGGILIVAPHPDDDVITAAGVVQRAHERGEAVVIVYVTNGDGNGQSVGTIRQSEAVTGQSRLGTREDHLIFLGYPDTGLPAIRSHHTTAGSSFTSEHGISATYASRGLGGTDYHSHRFGAPGKYNWPTMVGDLADVIATSRPSHIFTTSQWESHGDHIATYFLVIDAVRRVMATAREYNTTIHKTIVWPGDDSWPAPADGSTYFTDMPRTVVTDPKEMLWKDRESLDVPSAMQSGFTAANPKYFAIAAHESQGGVDRYIGRWIHKDEFFWTEQARGWKRPPVPNAGFDQEVREGTVVTLDGRASRERSGGSLTHRWRQVAGPSVTLSSVTSSQPSFTAPAGLGADAIVEFELVVSDESLTSVPDAVRVIVKSTVKPVAYGRNVASLAAISASTERAEAGQSATKVADGIVDGYPKDSLREWVTAGERAGAWIAMTWRAPVTVGKIVLHDRPNSADQLIAGVVEFSDGSKLPVGPLPNDGRPVEYTFPPRTIRSLRLAVTEVSRGTENVGLAEFQVFEISTNSPGAAPDSSAAAPKVIPRVDPATASATPATQHNIAPSATVTASSERAPLQSARKAVDTLVGGYPTNPEREWATVAQTAGAWIELRWPTPHLVDRVRLHDRPNPDDQVLTGTLTFSDGPPIAVGALDNDGTAVDVDFTPRSVRWIRFTVNSTSSKSVNTGLAEILVFERLGARPK